MILDVDEGDLKRGLLGLVMALVEIVEEILAHAAAQRVESGRLADDEVDRLGTALADVEDAIARIEADLDVTDETRKVRDQLDSVVGDLLRQITHPAELPHSAGRPALGRGTSAEVREHVGG